MNIIMSFGLIAVIVFVAFGLTWLTVVTMANIMAARQDGQKRTTRQDEPPAHVPDSAKFRRGA